jgi:hypothetical protein
VFGFSLPSDDINEATLRELRQYMQRHALYARRQMLILPHQQRARRLYLSEAQELGRACLLVRRLAGREGDVC